MAIARWLRAFCTPNALCLERARFWFRRRWKEESLEDDLTPKSASDRAEELAPGKKMDAWAFGHMAAKATSTATNTDFMATDGEYQVVIRTKRELSTMEEE